MLQIVIFNFVEFSSIALRAYCQDALIKTLETSQNENRVKSFYASRCAAKFITHRVSENLRISKNEEFGFPILVNESKKEISDHFISISHTQTTVVASLFKRPNGIDVEAISRRAENVIHRILSTEEKKFYNQFPDLIALNSTSVPKSLFYWVLKESAAKATGLGMNRGLDVFEIENPLQFPVKIKTPKDTPLPVNNLQCYPFIVDNFLYSACVDENELGRGILPGIVRLLDLSGKFEEIDGFK